MVQETHAVDTEQERQERIAEMAAEHGPNWSDEFNPGSAGCHELLDRTALVEDVLERYILSHPACIRNPDWYRLAEEAAAALRDLYQRVGAEHLGD